MKAMHAAAFINEFIGTSSADSGLLFFVPRVYLNKELELPGLFLQFRGYSLGNARPIYGVNDVKQAHGFSRLVCLQRSDQVESQLSCGGPQIWPLARSLLYAVFTKSHLSSVQDRQDIFWTKSLTNRNQRDVGIVAPYRSGGC